MEANRTRIVFHEANSCPEFWEQTRTITGMNIAVPLVEGRAKPHRSIIKDT